MNSRLGNKPPLYRLVKFIRKEAKLVDITCKLLSYKNVKLVRRKRTREAQAHLSNFWKKFENGSIDQEEMLLEATKFTPF